VLNGTVSLLKLENAAFQSFQNGRCVQSDKACILYMSPQGQIYAPESVRYGLQFTYGYDDTTQTIQYTISKKSDTPFVRADFKMQAIPLGGE
jgi:sulfatase maturation enzyme AslB (radical SAM superfamily)